MDAKSPPSESTQASPTPQRISTRADWPIFRGDPGLQGRSPGEAHQRPGLAWRVKLEQDILTTPVIYNGKVFIACDDGLLYALKQEDGSELWRLDEGFGFESSPFLSEGRLYVGSLDGVFYCLNATNGEVIWQLKLQAQISASANDIATTTAKGAT